MYKKKQFIKIHLKNYILMKILIILMEKMVFFYYEDKFGGLKLPSPNILGQFQLENISTAIATLRQLKFRYKR